ncbi:MAG: toll/interleukin-1 receptor domain-containing protein [Acidimicrobiia bacterium]|nr:toll/interleukin-1 receptor domain-containing protein [Acidimicrobiia bacterium]
MLDIYVVWHPDDIEGDEIARQVIEHFHGTPYVGLVGGSVEVYTRSVSWGPDSGTPRPIPPVEPQPQGLTSPLFSAVVLLVGVELLRAVEDQSSGWRDYLSEIVEARNQINNVGVFPALMVDWSRNDQLGEVLAGIQTLPPSSTNDTAVLCREISQQITQMIGDPLGGRLTVFISHTKEHSQTEDAAWARDLVDRVRTRIGNTHLQEFFDESDLHPGSDFEEKLDNNAASNSLLALRTGLYAGRDWCQREFLTAKQAGMPIVALNATRLSEERGSFLLDHVPVVGYQDGDEDAKNRSIDTALNLLVDRALRYSLWNLQQNDLRSLGIDWAPPEAPEPATLIPWLLERPMAAGSHVTIMHPDPPLGAREDELIRMLFTLASTNATVEIVTPRTYADRGGRGL